VTSGSSGMREWYAPGARSANRLPVSPFGLRSEK
jgi:hypothetical protein